MPKNVTETKSAAAPEITETKQVVNEDVSMEELERLTSPSEPIAKMADTSAQETTPAPAEQSAPAAPSVTETTPAPAPAPVEQPAAPPQPATPVVESDSPVVSTEESDLPGVGDTYIVRGFPYKVLEGPMVVENPRYEFPMVGTYVRLGEEQGAWNSFWFKLVLLLCQ